VPGLQLLTMNPTGLIYGDGDHRSDNYRLVTSSISVPAVVQGSAVERVLSKCGKGSTGTVHRR
jgi:hypothetical protein